MTDLATLAAKDQIAACIYQLFISTDQRDWAKVRACFTESVQFDMTSAGGTASTMTPKQITDGWEAGLKPMQHVHHQAGNLQIAVQGSLAAAFCYGVALHYRSTRSKRNVRRFVGSYDFRLDQTPRGWLISSFRFNLKFIDGNKDLEKAP